MAAVSYFLATLFLALLSKAHCDPYGLSATDIEATSVVLHWHTTEIWADVFKIHCSGLMRDFTDPLAGIDVVVHYAPKGVDHVMIGGMKADFAYSCIVIEELPDGDTRLSNPYRFLTKGTEHHLYETREPNKNHMSVAHLSLAAGLGAMLSLIMIGCTLFIVAVIVIRDQNELKKEASKLEMVVVACSNPTICNESDCPPFQPLAAPSQDPLNTPRLSNFQQVNNSTSSATSIESEHLIRPIYYTASGSDSESAGCMLKTDTSNTCFCTPPDADTEVENVERVSDQQSLTNRVIREESSVFNIPRQLPGHDHGGFRRDRTQSLSVFSSSSSSDGVSMDDMVDTGIDVDISGII